MRSSKDDAGQRLKKILSGAFSGQPTPLKDIPKGDGKPRKLGKPKKRGATK